VDLGWFEVSLNVRDIVRSLAFYEMLGFRAVGGSVEMRAITLQKADCRVGLYQGHLDPPETQLIFWQGDVAEIAQSLESKGLKFERAAAKDHDGGIGALLRDPDGHPPYFVNLPGMAPS
jgi:catechol 2,3-dioxygenase-like lactoylglutathione lyase family enzyme